MLRSFDHTDPALAARVVEIQRAAYAVEAELIGFDGIPQLTETVDDVRSISDLEWLGAFDGELLVGLIAWETDGEVVEIDRLAVDPAHARRGHGRRLVQAVPHAATTLVSTGEGNAPALVVYEREGFTQTGAIEVEPGVRLTQLRRDR